jgi:hypothetical protein
MSDFATGLIVASMVLAIVVLGWSLTVLVRRSKRPGKSFHAIGAALMLFGWGNLRDPANNPVAEAKDGRIRKGTNSGGPLDDEPG